MNWLRALVVCAAVLVPASAQAQGAAQPPVTFNRDVAPVLYENCTYCHRPGEAGPFSLLTYTDARQRARLIAAAVSSHTMPPWQPESEDGEFSGDRRLSAREIETLVRWADAGAPEGDAADAPVPPQFIAGWQMGAPDLVVEMPEAFAVPADGADVFRNIVIPIPLGERRVVRAVEFRPGNPRVVHHARMLFDDTGDIRRLDAAEPGVGFGGMDVPGARFPDGHFLGWAPGKMPSRGGFAWPLDPGNDLVVQLHLKPTGRVEPVQVSVGFYFTDTPPTTTPVMIRLGSKVIDIPADSRDYEVIDRFTLPVDVRALSIYPHAHYLCKDMLVLARRPNGKADTLLRIPNWNFNWQDEYTYAQPIDLPKGTTIEMRYRYDNTSGNPRNPSVPPTRVRFGSGTRDEMGELLLQVLVRRPAEIPALRAQIARKNLLADIAGEEKRVADVPDDAETRNALGVAYVQLGRSADALAQFEASLRTDPELAMAHYNLGILAMGAQRRDEAIARFERALRAQPDYAEAHNNLAIVLESAGRAAEAEAHYRAALESRPNHVAARNNLGRVLLARGDVSGASTEFRAVLRSRPDNADAHYNLGRVLFAERRVRDAVDEWKKAVAARPDSLVFTLDLAWTLATDPQVLDPMEAARLAERAVRATNQSNPAALDVLAAAYAADGRVDLAARTAQRALQQALAAHNDALATEIRQRLGQYQQALRGRADDAGTP